LQKYLLIGLGGALGSIARYWVWLDGRQPNGNEVPLWTFIINLTACVIIGFTLTLLAPAHGVEPGVEISSAHRICRAYSNLFKPMSGRPSPLCEAGHFLEASLYASAPVLGLAATWVGIMIAEYF